MEIVLIVITALLVITSGMYEHTIFKPKKAGMQIQQLTRTMENLGFFTYNVYKIQK